MANPYYKSTEEYLEEWGNRNTGSGKSVEEYRTNYQNALSAAVQKGEEKRQQSQVQTPVLDASKAAAAERAKRREEKRQAAGVALPSSTVIPGKNNAVMTPGGKNSVLDTVGTFQNIKNEQTGTSGTSGTSGMPSHAPFVSEDAKRENLTTNYQLREPTGAPIAENVQRDMASNMAWLTLSDEERAKRIAEYNDEQIIQQADAVNKQYDEKMAAYNQANAAYDEWLKKNQSDEVINAMSADYDAPEWVAFRAEGERLYAEAKKYDDEADALRLQADGLHDQALYIQDMRRLNELLPKMDEETRKALDTFAEGNYGYGLNTNSKQYYELMAKLGVGEREASRLAETWKRHKNKEGMEAFEGVVEKYTRAIPGVTHAAANLQSISANVVAPFTGFLAASFAGLSGGRYRSADPNGFLFAPTAFADTVRQTTASDIAGENGNIIRQGVADIYNGAMGAADNVLRTVMYGEKGTVVMAMDVFQRTVRNASASGATKEQALALGLASAGLEYATEQVSTRQILDIMDAAKMAAKEAAKDAVGEAAEQAAKKAASNAFIDLLKKGGKLAGKNFIEELPQELISFWGNAAAEAVILGQNSDFNKSVRNYMTEQGMTQEEAEAAAWKDLLWDGSLRVAWDTWWSTLFQTGFATGVKKVMENMAKDSAEGAPPTTTPPTTPPVTQQKATEAVQGEKTVQEAQTPTAEQTVQQVMQGLPGQTAQQTVQQQAQETPTAAVEATPPQIQMETKTAEQAQAEPQQQTQELSGAEQGALELAKLAEVENYPGREQKVEQDAPTSASEAAPSVLDNMRDGENGWGGAYSTASEALNDAIEHTNTELWDAFEAEDINALGAGVLPRGSMPIADAVSAVENDVRQEAITPMQGAQLLSEVFNDGGADALRRIYNPHTGNLHNSYLEKAKRYGNESQVAETDSHFPSYAENQIDNYKRSIAEERAKAKTNRKPTFGALKRLATTKPKSDPAHHGALTVDGKQYISNNGVVAVELNTPIDGITENDSLKVDVIKNFFEKTNEGVIDGNYTIDPVDISLIVKQIPKDTDAVVIVGNDAYNVRFVDAVLKAIADPVIMLSSDGKRAEQTLLVKGSNGQAVIMPIRITDSNKRNLHYVYRAEAEKATDELPFNYQQGGFGQNTVGGAQSQFDHEVKTSAQYSNTYAKTNDAELQQLSETAKEKDPTIYQYDATTEKESLHNAELRTATEEDHAAEYDALMEKDGWTAEDNDTAYAIEKQLMRDGKADEATKLERRRREEVTKSAQLVQSMAKYSRNADEAYSNGAMALGELTKDNVPKRFWKKQGFDTWKAELTKSFSEMVEKISAISEGDTEAMKDVIRSLARFRNTTAWFGMSKGLTKAAEAGLRNLDYDMAKTVALTQVANIPGDFVKRSVGEATKTIVFQNLLASLTSPIRNISGNTTSTVIEAVTDSTVGRFFDYLVSKATGVREVGNDIAHGKEFIEGGKKAAEFGSLCVELAIPMESDDKYTERSDKEGGVSHARTFSPKGGIVSRYLSAVEKYYSYAYGVSDLFYEGGSASAVDASLQKLGDTSGLTDESRKKVARDVGKRRTFKQDGHLTQFAKGMKKVANTLTDKFSPDLGLGDLTLPFARIGANLGTVGADYSGLGVFKGFGEVLTLISDAKKGKKIEPGRQRKAVTDAARGVTGFGVVAMMTAMALKGIIRGANDDDWDRAAYEESTGQVGVQFNVSAAIRDLIGKSTEWQKDDTVLSLDFLEPFNAQMLLGAAMAKDIQNNGGVTIGDYVKNSLESVTESILNNPGMELLGDLSDLVNDLQDAENPADYVDIAGETLGGIASEFVPLSAVMRQLAKTIDPVKRDTTGRNVWETALNRVMTGIPFASQTLPAKYGADGEPIARNEPGWLTAVNNFLNPGTATQLKDPAIADYLGALSDRTGNVSIYPESKAPKSFKVDGKEVEVYGKEDRETYHRTYMENIETVYGGLINDGELTELSDGRQLAVLGYAKEYATAMAKKALYPDYEMPAWMDDMEDDPVNTVLLHEYKSNQNDQGNSFSESKHEEMVGGGVSDQHAKDIQAKVAALMPEVKDDETGERYTNVRTVQKLEAISSMSLTEAEKQAALYAYADDTLDAKFGELLKKYDVAAVVSSYRANLDGGSEEETVKAIKQALGYGATTKQAEAVYYIYNPKPEKDKDK